MRHLNGVYTQAFNRRHQRVGHLFQGRFSAILVEKESHLLEVLRYVVLNPVRAGLVASPRDWAWSSFRATAAEAPAPPWLETAWSLAQFGGSEQRYREFVRPRRTGWKSFCASSSRALATTEGELAGHPRKRARERAILAYALRRFAGATGPAIAGVLGVSAWHASALARAGEGHWTGDIRLAARVEGAVGRT
jgi:hypothetical protein